MVSFSKLPSVLPFSSISAKETRRTMAVSTTALYSFNNVTTMEKIALSSTCILLFAIPQFSDGAKKDDNS